MAVTKETHSNTKSVIVFKPQKVEATQGNIAPVDLKGFDSVLITALVGASNVVLGEDNQLHIELQHSDSIADGAVFTACSNDEVKGFVVGAVIDDNPVTGTFASIVGAVGDAGLAFAASYTGAKRYVRPVINCVGGDHGNDGHGTEIAIGAVLQGAKYLPVV